MESPKSSMISFAFAYDSPIGRRLSEHSLTMLRSSMYTMPLTMSYGRNTITARMCSSSPPHVATFHGHIQPTHFARSDLRRLPCLVFNGPIPPKMVRYAMTNKLAAHIPAPIKPEYAAQARDMPAPYQASTNIPSVRPSSSDAPSSDAQEARARRKFPKVRSLRLTPVVQGHRRGPLEIVRVDHVTLRLDPARPVDAICCATGAFPTLVTMSLATGFYNLFVRRNSILYVPPRLYGTWTNMNTVLEPSLPVLSASALPLIRSPKSGGI